MKAPLEHLPDCQGLHYRLQLNVYKRPICWEMKTDTRNHVHVEFAFRACVVISHGFQWIPPPRIRVLIIRTVPGTYLSFCLLTPTTENLDRARETHVKDYEVHLGVVLRCVRGLYACRLPAPGRRRPRIRGRRPGHAERRPPDDGEPAEAGRCVWLSELGLSIVGRELRRIVLRTLSYRSERTPLHMRRIVYMAVARAMGGTRSTGQVDTCLIHSIRALGIQAPGRGPGPFWALQDGNSFLEPYGKELVPADWRQCGIGRRLRMPFRRAHHSNSLKVHGGIRGFRTGQSRALASELGLCTWEFMLVPFGLSIPILHSPASHTCVGSRRVYYRFLTVDAQIVSHGIVGCMFSCQS